MRAFLIVILLVAATGCGDIPHDPQVPGPVVVLAEDTSVTFALSHEDGRPAGRFRLDCYGIDEGDIITAFYHYEGADSRTEPGNCLPGSGAPLSDCIVLRRDQNLLLIRRDNKLVTIHLGTGTGTLALLGPGCPDALLTKVFFLQHLCEAAQSQPDSTPQPAS